MNVLDEHQVAEFNNHYEGTFALLDDGRLCYVVGSDGRGRTTTRVHIVGADGQVTEESVPMGSINCFNPLPGYFSSNNKLLVFSRHPTTQIKKSVHSRNAAVWHGKIKDGDLDFTFDTMSTPYINDLYKQRTGKAEKRSWVDTVAIMWRGKADGFALNAHYGLKLVPSMKLKANVLAVVGIGGIVGKVDIDNSNYPVQLFKPVAYMQPSVQEALDEFSKTKVETNVR